MSTMTIDALRRDECQPMTTAQMESAKAQIRPRNRANVNIVPYHIYDEDEHTVGEWRETISGVKKKKPVYEMTITLSEMSLASESWKTVYNNSNLNVNRIIMHSLTGANGTNYSSAVYVKYSSPNVQVYSIAGSLSLAGGGYLIIRYIKTTDEWEEANE